MQTWDPPPRTGEVGRPAGRGTETRRMWERGLQVPVCMDRKVAEETAFSGPPVRNSIAFRKAAELSGEGFPVPGSASSFRVSTWPVNVAGATWAKYAVSPRTGMTVGRFTCTGGPRFKICVLCVWCANPPDAEIPPEMSSARHSRCRAALLADAQRLTFG